MICTRERERAPFCFNHEDGVECIYSERRNILSKIFGERARERFLVPEIRNAIELFNHVMIRPNSVDHVEGFIFHESWCE